MEWAARTARDPRPTPILVDDEIPNLEAGPFHRPGRPFPHIQGIRVSAPRLDVVIVGAGAAGLAVAARLTDRGVGVVCLEARDRIGGRLLTVDAGGGRLDLGASWFWPGEDRVQKLVDTNAIPVHAQHIAGDAIYDTPGRSRRLDGNPIDVAAYRYTQGAQSVARVLAARLPPGTVRLDCPVSSISVDSAGVRVESSGTELAARQTVVAVPPAVAVETIRFHPGLPADVERLARLTPVWMGDMAKVVAVYSQPFWRFAGLAGTAVSDVGPLREVHDLSGPNGDDPAALFGFAPAGPNDPELRTGPVIDQLARLFGPLAAQPLGVVVQDWSREPWTSPAGADRSGAHHLFGHPAYQKPALCGRVHWASTETATTNPGHVEGALAAAEHAAAAVWQALQSPTGCLP